MAKNQLTQEHRNRFALTQREEMSHQISQLSNLSVYLIFTFIAVLLMDNAVSSPLFEKSWQVFLASTLLAFCVWGFSLVVTRFISRALHFHLLVSICTLSFIGAPLFVLIWVLQNLLGVYGWFLNAILVLSMLIGYADAFKQMINWLQISEKSLVTSGRLDKSSGIWNVKVPVQTNLHNPNQSHPAKLIVIVIQVFAFLASIYLGKTAYAPLLISLLCWIMLYFSFRQLGEPVAITLQLYFWERELDRTIIIMPEDYGD